MTRDTLPDILLACILTILASLFLWVTIAGCMHENHLKDACRSSGGTPVYTADDIICIPKAP